MRIFGKGSHHLPPIGIFYSIILALRDLGSGCLPEHLYREGSIKYCRKYKNENCSYPAEYHLWAHSPLHQRPVPSHGHHCRGYLPAAYQVNVDLIVTSSPLYKPHPLLSKGMACQRDNFLNFLSRNTPLNCQHASSVKCNKYMANHRTPSREFLSLFLPLLNALPDRSTICTTSPVSIN